jgi:hypothetical protein
MTSFSRNQLLLLVVCVCLMVKTGQAWLTARSTTSTVPSSWSHGASSLSTVQRPSTRLFSSRQPRRNLPKRRRRADNDASLPTDTSDGSALWDQAEVRPLISDKAVEQGQDYWIDEAELAKERERKQRMVQSRQQPGRVSDEKLWKEILSPYQQNWIGIATVIVVILAVIVSQFPELLNTPSIPIPDL